MIALLFGMLHLCTKEMQQSCNLQQNSHVIMLKGF
ncbi:hypothetical protein M758_11G042800 [Ceratodon purpureus]|uniref:Uncharacterized protein n=1 Tax=Ceratodon purpureus TaxID=3225 RepID=A0A8T0GC77_CERPU|nr:hypothetical protein KC19_11G044400 [Ceratodon purpureus]KAG0600555.1 hypothetical protein M758_11G042800 [Ceratodon purpureus]